MPAPYMTVSKHTADKRALILIRMNNGCLVSL